MAERICIPFAHPYDQFAAFFYEGRVYLSDTSYPIGQCCVDIVNMDEEVLSEIDRCVEEFIPAARKLLMEKTNSAVAFAQDMLNVPAGDIRQWKPVFQGTDDTFPKTHFRLSLPIPICRT